MGPHTRGNPHHGARLRAPWWGWCVGAHERAPYGGVFRLINAQRMGRGGELRLGNCRGQFQGRTGGAQSRGLMIALVIERPPHGGGPGAAQRSWAGWATSLFR